MTSHLEQHRHRPVVDEVDEHVGSEPTGLDRRPERPQVGDHFLDQRLGVLGTWVASTLVKLGDLRLAFLPAEETS